MHDRNLRSSGEPNIAWRDGLSLASTIPVQRSSLGPSPGWTPLPKGEKRSLTSGRSPPPADINWNGRPTSIGTGGRLQPGMTGRNRRNPQCDGSRPLRSPFLAAPFLRKRATHFARATDVSNPASSTRHGGTLSPRQLAAFLSPSETALRREQRQRPSRFLFRFRLFRLFSFPVRSSLSFRHNSFLTLIIQEA